MKTVARFITRLQGERDGLFIGVTMDKNVFEPNTVYEIVDIMDAFVIRKVGKGRGMGPNNGADVDSKVNFHWASDIGHIIGSEAEALFLTESEMKERFKYFKEQFEHE